MPLRPVITVAGATDKGCVRANNEDAFRYLEDGADFWAAVADGCGGENAGEVASRIAMEVFASELSKHRESGRDVSFVIRDAVVKANRMILEEAQKPECKGMGTTFSGIYIRDKNIFSVHAGDSRIYRKRDNVFEQLTEDHTWVEEEVRFGRLTREQADHHPKAGVLMKALGIPDFGSPDIDFLDAREGDTIMITTDGLHRVVALEETAPKMDLAPEETVRELISLALERGAPDNVTIIALRVDGFRET